MTVESQYMIDQSLFRNYDVRGEYGTVLTEEAAYHIAHAYAALKHPRTVVVGSDARISSPTLKQAVVRGLTEQGVDVIDIGLVSTDAMYFSTWFYGYDGGIMVTASHMPREFNGLKFLALDTHGVLAPIGRGLGMEELEKLTLQSDTGQKVTASGNISRKDIWDDFVRFTHEFVDVGAIKPLHVVMDAGNGMGGFVADKVFAGLPLSIERLCFEPDGNFPNHPANPILEENRVDSIEKVKATGADLGVAWDADCDRVYFIDEKGNFVHGDFIATLLALHILKKHPGEGIVYDLRFSRALKDWVGKAGGIPHMSRVGHTYIKHHMYETKSIFGGEISGHYYFARNKYMENGFAPVLMIMEMMSAQDKTLSELVRDLGSYYISGEMNFPVKDTTAVIRAFEETYQNGHLSKLDGLSVEFADWHFNVRPSANDPVLRLTLEATSPALLDEKKKAIISVIESFV